MKGTLQLYRSFFFKIGIAALIFSLCRILFYSFNLSYFGNLELVSLIGGIRFDLMTITIVYAPFIIAYFFLYNRKSTLLKILFHFSNSISILTNCIDFEYYKFTLKRTTSDLFTTSGIGSDILKLLPQFIIDFWYLVIIIAVLIALSEFLYRKTENQDFTKISIGNYLVFLIPMLALLVVGFRGGIQLRPLSVLYASKYASAQNVPIVLNTPFTLLKSAYKEDLKPLDYYSNSDLESIYTPLQYFEGDSIPKRTNVVLIVLESFSKEYIGYYNNGKGYTPFLDSLITQSLSFEQAYANGKKSIEALPALLSGIPTLMNSAYISSKYASNQISSIANELDQRGYQTSFYHGGTNGTMGFNAYSQMAGIKKYIGLNEYPNEGDYDGNWGIFDEPFLQFCVEDLDQTATPFFATIFTLSSHHPYKVPDKYANKFPKGELPILQSVAYADYALKRFFESAKKESWFDETLFILTADHTSQNQIPKYGTRTGIYEIPLLFYSPKYLPAKVSQRISQQADIFPSILDFMGYEANINTFGNSVFDSTKTGFAINYLNETYQFIQGDYALQHDGKKIIALYDLKSDSLQTDNLKDIELAKSQALEKKFLAILQQYNNRMIKNQLIAE